MSSASTEPYDINDPFIQGAAQVADNWDDDVAAVMSSPQLSPIELFPDDGSWGSDGPPPSPPILRRTRRRTPPNSPPSRRARTS